MRPGALIRDSQLPEQISYVRVVKAAFLQHETKSKETGEKGPRNGPKYPDFQELWGDTAKLMETAKRQCFVDSN